MNKYLEKKNNPQKSIAINRIAIHIVSALFLFSSLSGCSENDIGSTPSENTASDANISTPIFTMTKKSLTSTHTLAPSLTMSYASTEIEWISPEWTDLGPEGGEITSIAIDPIMSSNLFVGTSKRGIFKSNDGGLNWTVANSGLPHDSITAIAIDTTSPDNIYIGTFMNGMFKSINGGKSWFSINDKLSENGIINAISIDPKTPSTLYLAGSSILKSINSGESWSTVLPGPGYNHFDVLVIDPNTPATIYAGTNGDGIIKSVNGGGTWRIADAGLPDGSVVCSIKIDPVSPTTLYAGTIEGLFISLTAGEYWTPINTVIPYPGCAGIEIAPKNAGILYVAGYSGVYRSTDGGKILLKIGNWDDNFINVMTMDPNSPSTLYAGTVYNGMMKSSDGGLIWTTINSHLHGNVINSLAIHPKNQNTIYAGTDTGVYRSENRGREWVAIKNDLKKSINGLAINPLSPATLYASSMGDIYKSINNGNTWASVFTEPEGECCFNSLLIDKTTPTTLFVGTSNGYVYKSANEGMNWTQNGICSSIKCVVYNLTIDNMNPNTLYASTNSGLYKSTNGGVEWYAIHSGIPNIGVRTLVIDPFSADTLYAGTMKGGVFKSENGGDDWVMINNGLPQNTAIPSLSIDPSIPNTIYAGTLGNGVYKSSNGGKNWSFFGLNETEISTLIIIPNTPKIIYAGTWIGVYSAQLIE